jgi:ribonuclease HI
MELDKAGKPWDKNEESQLIKEYTIDKLTLMELSKLHKRMPGGIRSRLKKLELVPMKHMARGYSEYQQSDLFKDMKIEKKEKLINNEKIEQKINKLKTQLEKLEKQKLEVPLKNAFSVLMAPKKSSPAGYKIVKGTEEQEKEAFRLQFDGKSEPNPGPSSAGAVLYYPNSQTVKAEVGEYIPNATNNEAEYTGLLIGFHLAVSLGIKHLVIAGDSNLVINQVFGEWKVKSDNLKGLHKEIRTLFKNFDFIAAKHVYRDHNDYADNITNVVFDKKKSYFKKDGMYKKTVITNGVNHVLWSDEDED